MALLTRVSHCAFDPTKQIHGKLYDDQAILERWRIPRIGTRLYFRIVMWRSVHFTRQSTIVDSNGVLCRIMVLYCALPYQIWQQSYIWSGNGLHRWLTPKEPVSWQRRSFWYAWEKHKSTGVSLLLHVCDLMSHIGNKNLHNQVVRKNTQPIYQLLTSNINVLMGIVMYMTCRYQSKVKWTHESSVAQRNC